MRSIFIAISFLFATGLAAQEINIIPQPKKINRAEGHFLVSPTTVILLADAGENATASFLNQHLKTYYGFQLKIAKSATSNYIRISTKKFIRPGAEGKYDLTVNAKRVDISGDSYSGTFYGMQTLLQLFPIDDAAIKTKTKRLKIPCLAIQDEPRFEYRGMHFDVGRHFFPTAYVKRYIDFLAYHKFNIFHWHLTEDQGWRIEIKKYPLLTAVGGKRNGTIIGRYPGTGSDNEEHQGFYTQAEIKDVIQYAQSRFVEVIPEIEMPGHSSAAIAAYPFLSCFPEKPTAIPGNMISAKSIVEQKNGRIKLVQETWGVFDDVFCAGKDSTFTFLENVLDEVITLFPSKYVHIGGDECPKTHWKQCPACQKRIKDLQLKDEHELQSYFVQRIEKYLNSKGKTLIGWDEILEGGLAPNAQVMSWRGEAGGIAAAQQNHFVIMTPGSHVYFDHSQTKNEDSVTIGGYTPLEKVYSYEPVPAELTEDQGKFVRGAQANLWTEYISNSKKIEYLLFPRMSALSEVLWSSKENRNWEDFEQRLKVQFKRFNIMKLNYSKAYFEPTIVLKPSASPNKLILDVKTKTAGTSFYLGNKTTNSFHLFTNEVSYEIKASGIYGLRVLDKINPKKQPEKWGNAFLTGYDYLFSADYSLHFSKSTAKKISLTNEASKSYSGDGAFTLVNAVVNERGLARSQEFLGFSGTDCEAVIDLGKQDSISKVSAFVFSQVSSWIWPPAELTVFASTDGINFQPIKGKYGITPSANQWDFVFPTQITQYVKIVVKNQGNIPAGNPGAGSKAWLFVSELQVY